jgi:glyoxalase family protein
VGTKGAGQVAVTSFSVPEGSLGFWSTRLRNRGLVVRNGVPRFQEESVAFADPSGLNIELIASRRDDRPPWTSGVVGTDAAIRGLHSVTMIVQSPDKTLELLTVLLGLHIVDETEGRIRVAAPGEGPGRTIDIVYSRDTGPAANGLGTVHHVAMAIADAEAQARLREELLELGYKVTDIMDRQYFRSIYFREPGGVLLEVATVGPGFTLDEDLPCLGRDLKLPPWEEPNRSIIQAALPPVAYR